MILSVNSAELNCWISYINTKINVDNNGIKDILNQLRIKERSQQCSPWIK